MHEHSSQPRKDACTRRDRRAHARRRPARRHVGADMAMADNLMQLPVAHLEEALGFAVRVILQALRTEDRIFECDGDRRSVGAHSLTHVGWSVFGARQRREAAARALFEKLRPALKALAPIGDESRCFGMNVGNGVDLVKGLVLHGRLLYRQMITRPHWELRRRPTPARAETDPRNHLIVLAARSCGNHPLARPFCQLAADRS
ncbi:hypothetical protein MPLA_140021 [Mesorhizobium sp. ORS 3359]|nr:hypothetical protein MPLA_140021 [Mesorhizobium sp. ORS 3359]